MVAMAGGRLVIDWASELELVLVPYVARWTKTFRGPRSTVCVHSSRSKGRHDIDVTDHVDVENADFFRKAVAVSAELLLLRACPWSCSSKKKGDADHRAEMKNDDSYRHLRSYRRKTTPDAH